MREAALIILSVLVVLLMVFVFLSLLSISKRLEARLMCLQRRRSEAVEHERQFKAMISRCESSLQEIKNLLT